MNGLMNICEEKPKSYAWVWGTLILIILGAGGFWVYKRSKKLDTDRKKTLKKRSERFQERMNPPSLQMQPEVRRSLGRE